MQLTAAHSGRGGDSLESGKDHDSDLGFEWGFLVRHWGDAANPFCSPWDWSGRQWQLATVRPLPQAWAMACEVSIAPLAMGKAPTVAVNFCKTPRVVDLIPGSG
jgi:hypothetical protein